MSADTSPSAASEANKPAVQRPRRLRPQFSLRVLLLLLTLFAIGFPVWYVWPYTDREVHYEMGPTGKPDKTKLPIGETVTSMKRVIGGKPVKHGLKISRFPGRISQERSQEFVNDVAHGAFSQRYGDDYSIRGRYEQGKKAGEWVILQAGFTARQAWRAGKRHGTTVIGYPDGEKAEFTYADGVLTHRDGNPVSYPIFERIANGDVPDGVSLKALSEDTALEFIETPIAHVAMYLHDFHQAPIEVDPVVLKQSKEKGGPKITARYRGIDLATALSLAADDAGLVCDYRNGRIWITLPDDKLMDANRGSEVAE